MPSDPFGAGRQPWAIGVELPIVGSLDEAWGMAEAAMPSGWQMWSLDRDTVNGEWRAIAGQTVDEGGAPILGIGSGETPAAALRGLAERLRLKRT